MKPIAPEQRDSIPREVATAMLTEPRARLTNRMRKNCVSAREKVFASTAPFRRMPAVNAQGEIVKGYGYVEVAQRTAEYKTKLRFSRATLRQLGHWIRRSIARRYPLQRKYLAVQGNSLRHEQARFVIAQAVQRLDLIRDMCEDEIAMRSEKCNKVIAMCAALGTGKSVRFFPRE